MLKWSIKLEEENTQQEHEWEASENIRIVKDVQDNLFNPASQDPTVFV